jgi:PhzF family phenazine biosynthesis protein
LLRIPIFHVDAFADRPHSGNPAAVCLLDSWLDDEWLRKVAAENNLPATAFLVPSDTGYKLRWFTTCCEIRLCGHATMAAGLVVLKVLQPSLDVARFEMKHGGLLEVQHAGDALQMDFPALISSNHSNGTDQLIQAVGVRSIPTEIFEANDTWIAVFNAREVVAGADPDVDLLEKLHPYAVAITAPGKTEDFVSRYFAPSYGIPEDQVTGSLHCALTPYWSRRLAKNRLKARQLSARGGELMCEMAGDRVRLGGTAILTMRGTLQI